MHSIRLKSIANTYEASSLVFGFGLLLVTSFVWLYHEPLCVDMFNHLADAKAFVDLIGGCVPPGYPYQLDIQVSSYELPVVLLGGLIKLFGVNAAAKVALSAYAASVPLLIYFLAGRLDPASRWTRLTGLPFALNNCFHWGMWSFLMGLVAALSALLLSLVLEKRRIAIPVEALARVFVFLCHPTATLALGIVDVSLALYRQATGEIRQLNSWLMAGCRLLMIWLPSAVLAVYVAKKGMSHPEFIWSSIGYQLMQLIQPFYVNDYVLEELVPLVIFGILTWYAIRHSVKGGKATAYLFAGLVLVVLGCIIPRNSFMGSYQNGYRIILIGFLLIAASWSSIEKSKRGLLIIWIVTALCFNLAAGHYAWHKYEKSALWALDTMKKKFSDYSIIEISPTGYVLKHPLFVGFGMNIENLAWAYGYIKDSYNMSACFGLGPVKYVGYYNNNTSYRQDSEKKACIFFHLNYASMENPIIFNPVIFNDIKEIYSDSNKVYAIAKLP